VGVSTQYTVTAANLTAALPNDPQSTLAATFTPTTVNNAPGELVKLFTAVFSVAGTHQLKTVAAAAGIESNTLSVTVSATPTPPPPPPPPPPAPTTATLSGASTATVDAPHLSRVQLDAPAQVAHTVTWTRSASGAGPATSTIAVGQTSTGDVASTWGAGAVGAQSVDFTISPSLTRAGRPLAVTVGVVSQATFTTIRVRNKNAGAGVTSVPYSAAVMPLQGQCPSGSRLYSDNDATMRSVVLARWPDNSAAIVVCSGRVTLAAGASTTINVNQAPDAGHTNLDTAAIAAQVTSISGDFGAAGSFTRTSFGSPLKTWWASPTEICAMYRDTLSSGLVVMSIVKAWSDRAQVECLPENSAVNTAVSGAVAAPAAVSYTGATITINGSVVATVNASGAPEGTHAPFRGWYASAWVGAGDAQVRATQAHEDLQDHPLLWKCDQPLTDDLTSNGNDAYTPWSTGRHRATGMGGAGDHPSIGPLPEWEAQALQSGDHRAWNSVEANALVLLGYAINYRDTTTGLVPTFTQIGARGWQNGLGQWPMQAYNGAMGWEVAHHPAAGLMAFLSRPSPIFIELAQKVAVVNGTYGAASTPNWTSGLHGYYYQVRGRTWCLRSQAHAAFLTPTGDAWRASAVAMLAANVAYNDQWRADAKFALTGFCDQSPSDPFDHDAGVAGFQASQWQHQWAACELHRLSRAGLLTGANLTAVDTLADWALSQAVRFVNEQADTGSWRYNPYRLTVGDNAASINSLSTWGAERARAGNHNGVPPAVAGPFFNHSGAPTSFTTGYVAETSGLSYSTYLWAAVATAAERGIPGAEQAWEIVNTYVVGLDAWRGYFGLDPRWGVAPRILSNRSAETGSITSTVWTPGRDAAGIVTSASFKTVPKESWRQVAGTVIGTALDAAVKAAVPGWQDHGTTKWPDVLDGWNGVTLLPYSAVALLVVAGGHAGSSNNGHYRLAARKMLYEIERLPSDTTVWSPSYLASNPNGTFTPCGESAAEYNAKVAANTLSPEDDWYWDELYWDRMPTSRHQYSSTCAVPETDEVVMTTRRLWRYRRPRAGLPQGQWWKKRLLNDERDDAGGNAVPSFDGANTYCFFDPVAGEVLHGGSGDGRYRSVRYNVRTNAWNAAWSPWAIYDVADTQVGEVVTILAAPKTSGPYSGHVWQYNLRTRQTVVNAAAVQYAAGLSRANMMRDDYYDHGVAMCWVPPRNRFWFAMRTIAGTQEFFELEPGTWTISRAPFHGVAGAPVPHPNICRKMLWLPPLNSVLLLAGGLQNAFLYRF
jgi:hypothetical protein